MELEILFGVFRIGFNRLVLVGRITESEIKVTFRKADLGEVAFNNAVRWIQSLSDPCAGVIHFHTGILDVHIGWHQSGKVTDTGAAFQSQTGFNTKLLSGCEHLVNNALSGKVCVVHGTGSTAVFILTQQAFEFIRQSQPF